MQQRLGSVMYCALAAHTVIASTSVARPGPGSCDEDLTTINCTQMPFLGPGQTWVPPQTQSEIDWVPNSLPIAWINLRPGTYCTLPGQNNMSIGNPRGLQTWWYDRDDDPTYGGTGTVVIDALEQRLTSAYNAGYRRAPIHLPAGVVNSQDWTDYNTAWEHYNGKTA